MADKASKQPENVPGQWYVDTSCNLCRVCLEEAPNLIKYNDDETYVYFFKQPETPEETAAAQRALDVCPMLSIGNDGGLLSTYEVSARQLNHPCDRMRGKSYQLSTSVEWLLTLLSARVTPALIRFQQSWP